jgi:hypothetical protein
MVLNIQTVHHILKNTAVQNVNKQFVYITDLTSPLKLLRTIRAEFTMDLGVCAITRQKLFSGFLITG